MKKSGPEPSPFGPDGTLLLPPGLPDVSMPPDWPVILMWAMVGREAMTS